METECLIDDDDWNFAFKAGGLQQSIVYFWLATVVVYSIVLQFYIWTSNVHQQSIHFSLDWKITDTNI